MAWATSTQLVSTYSQICNGTGFFSQTIKIFSIQEFPAQSHTSYQISQLKQQSCSSNPLQTDQINMLSLLLDADALLTEASHTYKGSEEASTITLFSAETDFKQNSCFASSSS